MADKLQDSEFLNLYQQIANGIGENHSRKGR